MAQQALERYRILDFGRVMAGPLCGGILADMGAEVIKVESRVHMETGRRGRPVVGEDIAGGDMGKWPEMQPAFHTLNRNKLSITLDFTKPKSIALLRRLAAISDVVTENFAPGVMDRLGLGYRELSSANPSLVYLAMSGPGQTGPLKHIVGYATANQALSGFSSFLGYEDGKVLGTMQAAYADVSAAIFGASAICAALFQRNRTGRGSYIDFSQWENLVNVEGAPLADYFLNGRIATPHGNEHQTLAPHGNYHCKGADKWISIGVANEAEWRGLCEGLTRPEWVNDSRFANARLRRKHRRELDAFINESTVSWEARELTQRLQQYGVAAAPLATIEDQIFDPHHKARGTFLEVNHPLVGYEVQPGFPLRLSATPGSYRRHAPTLGNGNSYVFCEQLGLSPDDLDALATEGVVA